jgi:hypothetical protein
LGAKTGGIGVFNLPAIHLKLLPCLASQNRRCPIAFKAGKNRDGYFTCDDLIEQVNEAFSKRGKYDCLP